MVSPEMKVCFTIMKMMEAKLSDLMTDREYDEFMTECAKAGYRVSIEELPDGGQRIDWSD